MKKEELMKKLDGVSDGLADKILEAYADYVPKSRFNEVNEAKKNAEALVKEHDAQIEALKEANKDNDDLKKQIADLQEANKKAVEAKDAEIKQIRIDNAVQTALSASGAKNNKAVLALLNLRDAELNDDGTVKGLNEQLEALKTADDSSFLFKPADKGSKKASGVTPKSGNDPKKQGVVTKEEFAKMGYKQRLELYNTDKEQYDSLIADDKE